jgi:hypothetical protein
MKKLLLLAFLFFNATPVFADEVDTVEETEEIVIVEETEEIEEEEFFNEIATQLELAQNIIVALAVSFVGTSTFGLLVRYTFNKIIKAANDRIKQATEENKISQETANSIYQNLETFESLVQSQINDVIKELSQMTKSYEELLVEFKARDAKLKELVEESFGD